ncbi:MAG: fused response regulator/phosphatase [Geobacter sp.]|nr:fused response regulator/phosphatase [Geobacter sp.]
MPKVLIVDDSPANRKKLCAILRDEPYELLEASNGSEAIDLVLREHPDVVLINTAMPEQDGHKLCNALKNSDQTADIPLLLLSGWGITLGSVKGLELGALDYISKPFNEREIQTRIRNFLNLHQLSESLKKTRSTLLEKEHQTDESLKSAALIQQSLLPHAPPIVESFDFAWQFIPSYKVGGDLFNVFKLDENHIGAYVLDVCGSGVPAAMITTSVAQSLNPFVGNLLKKSINRPPYYELISPAEVLAELNREYPIERFDKFFTVCYLLLDVRTGTVRYSNAANPLPVHLGRDGRVEWLREGGPIIGVEENIIFEEGEIHMKEGDRLFLYTDGIVEHADEAGELYGEERFVETLQKTRYLPLQAACIDIMSSLMGFGNSFSPGDDITLLGIEFKKTV